MPASPLKISDPDTLSDEMLPEYRFDYSKARQNRFIRRPNPMPKSRRKPPRAALSLTVLRSPRTAVTLGFGAALALSIVGFVYFTAITLEIQRHFAPEAAHPYDGYAALCLFFALAAGALLLLNLRDPPPTRWRRGRRLKTRRRPAKRRRAGTIEKL